MCSACTVIGEGENHWLSHLTQSRAFASPSPHSRSSKCRCDQVTRPDSCPWSRGAQINRAIEGRDTAWVAELLLPHEREFLAELCQSPGRHVSCYRGYLESDGFFKCRVNDGTLRPTNFARSVDAFIRKFQLTERSDRIDRKCPFPCGCPFKGVPGPYT